MKDGLVQLIEHLRRELKSKFGPEEFWFDTTSYKELIDLRIKYQDGYFKFLVPKDRVTSSSARIFALMDYRSSNHNGYYFINIFKKSN